jgi:hypothetical protein
LLLLDPSRGSTEQVAAWRLNLFKTVYGFLASNSEDKPARGAVVITLLAYPEAAFLGTTEGCPDVSQMAQFSLRLRCLPLLAVRF